MGLIARKVLLVAAINVIALLLVTSLAAILDKDTQWAINAFVIAVASITVVELINVERG